VLIEEEEESHCVSRIKSILNFHFIFKAGLSCKVKIVKEMVYNVQNFAIFLNPFIILKHPHSFLLPVAVQSYRIVTPLL
jgi:hypothetical protein